MLAKVGDYIESLDGHKGKVENIFKYTATIEIYHIISDDGKKFSIPDRMVIKVNGKGEAETEEGKM